MAAEDEELKVSKQKAKQKFDELASTTSAIMDALKKYGQEVTAAQEAVKEAENEYNNQKTASQRLKTQLKFYENTVIGIVQTTRQEIAVSKAKQAVLAQELNVAQQLLNANQQRVKSVQEDTDVVKSRIAVIKEEQTVVKQQLDAAKALEATTKQSVVSIQQEMAASEARTAAIKQSNQQLQSQESAILEELGQLRNKGQLTDEELSRRNELNSQLDGVLDSQRNNKDVLSKENDLRYGLTGQLADLSGTLTAQQATVKELDSKYEEQRSSVSAYIQELGQLGQKSKQLNAENANLQKAVKDKADKLKNEKTEEINTRVAGLQKGLNQLSQTLGKVANELNKLVDIVRKTQQQFGLSAGSAAKLEFGILSASIKSYAQSLITAGKVIPVSREEIKAATEAYQQEFGGVLTPEAAADIAGQAKKMGVTASALATARRQFLTQTMGDAGKARSAEQKFIGEFAKKGLTSKEALEAIGRYSEIYARNGGRFAASFARAAAEAKKIGVDLGKIDQIGDNIIGDFEGFLEKTAELGAMGFNFDSSRLAEIAESGDTGALMDELRSQLAAQGKDLTNLRRSEQLALSQAFGIPMAELQRLAAPKKEDTESASGEKVLPPNELDADSNSKLGQLVNLMQTAGVILGVISAAVALIASKMVMGGLKDLLMRRGGGGRRGGRGARARTPRPGRPPRATGGTTRMGSIASRATGAARRATTAVASRGGSVLRGLGKVARVGLRAGKAIPVVGQALALGMGAYDAFTGFNADPNATTGQKFKNAGSSMLSGLTFGLLGKDASEIRESALARGPAAPVRRSEQLAVARATGLPVAGAAVAGTVAAATTAPTTPTAPSVDFTKLEQKLDQVVRAIGAMKVELDGVKVGRVVAASAASTQQVGVFSRST